MKLKLSRLAALFLALCLILSLLPMAAMATKDEPQDEDDPAKYTVTCGTNVQILSGVGSDGKAAPGTEITVWAYYSTDQENNRLYGLSYTFNGTSYPISFEYDGPNFRYVGTFTMPNGNVTISAEYRAVYRLTVNYDKTMGRATPSDLSEFADKQVSIIINPNEGYTTKSVTAQKNDGSSLAVSNNNSNVYTITMPAQAATVNVTFAAQQAYNITIANMTNGRITVPSSSVNNGEQVVLTITPNDGYVLDTLSVKDANNSSVSVSGTGNTRTFNMPESNVTISATFKKAAYTITCDPVSNGTVTWTPKKDSYEYNDWVRVTVEPKRDYYLQSLKINGTEVKTNGTYYDFQIREDVNITATFTNRLGVTVNYNGSGLYGTVNIFDYNWSSASYFKYNDSVWIECKPKDGYAVDEVTVTDDVTGLTISTSKSSFYDDCYSFTMPSHPVTVNVKFVVGEHKIEIAETKNGKVTVSQENASEDDRIIVSVEPDKNYKLTLLTIKTADGVKVTYTESAIKENTYYFDMPDADVTISAVFGYALDYMPFTDVKSYDWFYDAVQFVYGSGIMNGVSETSFSPDSDITRGMVVTMLWRLAGEPYVGGSYFNDVPSGEYYSVAVAWSAKYGIVDGVTETTFGVNASITREQLAAILYRYAKWMGYSTLGSSLSGYSDVNSISSWAKDAMGWAVRNGIISGVTTTRLNPTGTATRAQVAQMFLNFYEFLN